MWTSWTHWEMMGCLLTNLLLTQTRTRLRIQSRNPSGDTLTCITGLGCSIDCIIEVTSKAGPLTSVGHSLTSVLGLKKCTESHTCQRASRLTREHGPPLFGSRVVSPKGTIRFSSHILRMCLRKFACLVQLHRNANVIYPQTLKSLAFLASNHY
jgi:hypothetical protein